MKWGDVVVTYGDTCFFKHELSADLVEHENYHIPRQVNYPGGPAAWWERYYIDPEFRFNEELPAYKRQFNYIRKIVKDRNKRNEILLKIADILSGKIYGNLGRKEEIIKALKY